MPLARIVEYTEFDDDDEFIDDRKMPAKTSVEKEIVVKAGRVFIQ